MCEYISKAIIQDDFTIENTICDKVSGSGEYSLLFSSKR